jgi:hypothetical protein
VVGDSSFPKLLKPPPVRLFFERAVRLQSARRSS